jgi:transposase
MLLSEGQMSDHTGAKHLYPRLPSADTLIADKGYDSNEFRQALAARNIEACIPPKRNRKLQHPFDRQLYKTRHKIENMFGRLKDWRRISTRYDRCAHTFFSAICIAASFIFYLNQ